MWNISQFTKEEVDYGWTPRQIRKKNATRNRLVRLPKMQETIQRSVKQEEDLNA